MVSQFVVRYNSNTRTLLYFEVMRINRRGYEWVRGLDMLRLYVR